MKPTSYGLELTIIPAQPKMSGIVRIAAQVERATEVVWLNQTGIKVTSAKLNGAPATIVSGGDKFVGIGGHLDRGAVQIEVAYEAVIDHEKSQGIYAVKEGDIDYAYTFFEPIDARRAFPCFDEPNYKVPWQVTFHIQDDQIARGNAPIIKETPEANHMKRVELAPTKPLPSYLVAFMVGPFDDVDDGVAGRAKTPIHFILPKGRQAELAYAKEVTPKVVAALENYMDMDYPFVKLDVAVVPRYWGTMEHPGIVAMGQSLTLIRPDQKNVSREQDYEDILAHELGHYWFGDLVTLAWWNDTWLNESLGQWFDAVTTETVVPGWHWQDSRASWASYAMRADETLSARATRQPVKTDEDIQASFDGATTYVKGATVFRQLEHFVGPDKWQAFIRKYVRAHAYANATADDFIGDMRKELGNDAADSITSYVTHPGVPIANVHAECAQKQIVVDPLTRSLPFGVQEPANDRMVYKAPICVRYGDAKHSDRTCTTGEPIKVDYCPSWIVPNAGAYGYYRSKITAKQAAQLLARTSPAKLTAAERMSVIHDVSAGVTRNEIQPDEALVLVKTIIADPDPGVQQLATRVAVLHVNVVPEDMYQRMRAWFAATYAPLARKLTWTPSPSDSPQTRELRQAAIGTVASIDPKLLADARRLVTQWLKDRTGDDQMVGIALGAVAAKGTAADFDALKAAVDKPRDRNETGRLYAALGSFKDPELAKRARELVFDT
ncbi:MAG TPA: M1 family metallopeptidase, partial [Kofleriaceae bacterium]